MCDLEINVAQNENSTTFIFHCVYTLFNTAKTTQKVSLLELERHKTTKEKHF